MEFGDVPINLNRLRLFLAVVEHGGVRKAAEAISISQPAVSQAIQALEAELDLDVLERVGRQVRPTEAGMLLAEHGRRIFAEVLEARRALDEVKGIARASCARRQHHDRDLHPAGCARSVPSALSRDRAVPERR